MPAARETSGRAPSGPLSRELSVTSWRRDWSRKALLAAAVTKETYGRAFGFERMMDTVGAIVGPATAGQPGGDAGDEGPGDQGDQDHRGASLIAAPRSGRRPRHRGR